MKLKKVVALVAVGAVATNLVACGIFRNCLLQQTGRDNCSGRRDNSSS